jgi:hypothetical protein
VKNNAGVCVISKDGVATTPLFKALKPDLIHRWTARIPASACVIFALSYRDKSGSQEKDSASKDVARQTFAFELSPASLIETPSTPGPSAAISNNHAVPGNLPRLRLFRWRLQWMWWRALSRGQRRRVPLARLNRLVER